VILPITISYSQNASFLLFLLFDLGILMNLLSGGKFLRKNARKPMSGEGGDYYVVNGTYFDSLRIFANQTRN
jgi:hypothetical protein